MLRITRPRRNEVRSAAEGTGSAGVEFGWRAHTAMEAWTARADLKASILLALQGVAAVLVVTSRDVVLESPWRWPAVLGVVALGLLALAICVTAGATLPALGSPRTHRAEHDTHMIYFGHLRFWQSATLTTRLSQMTAQAEVGMLAQQLVFLARINWRKHRLLQLSVLITILVIVTLAVAAVGAQVAGARPISGIS